MKIPVTLNEEKTILDVQPDESLLKILQEQGCSSAKSGCKQGLCGSCTILLNDKPVASCKIPAGLIKDAEIVTLEHFSKTDAFKNIMEGFNKAGIKLCGYCNAGKIFSTYQILKMNKKPERKEIAEQVRHLAPCCTDLESLVNGIVYAVDISNKKETRISKKSKVREPLTRTKK